MARGRVPVTRFELSTPEMPLSWAGCNARVGVSLGGGVVWLVGSWLRGGGGWWVASCPWGGGVVYAMGKHGNIRLRSICNITASTFKARTHYNLLH